MIFSFSSTLAETNVKLSEWMFVTEMHPGSCTFLLQFQKDIFWLSWLKQKLNRVSSRSLLRLPLSSSGRFCSDVRLCSENLISGGCLLIRWFFCRCLLMFEFLLHWVFWKASLDRSSIRWFWSKKTGYFLWFRFKAAQVCQWFHWCCVLDSVSLL